MKQQPLLTADEVLELLKTIPLSKRERVVFEKRVAPHIQVGSFTVVDNPEKEIPLLEKCANFLRDNGVYVFFWVDPKGVCHFVAGEVGRVYEKLLNQMEHLSRLYRFLLDYGKYLHGDISNIAKAIRFYGAELVGGMLAKLSVAYDFGFKERLPELCAEGWEVSAKVDTFLQNPLIVALDWLIMGLEEYQK